MAQQEQQHHLSCAPFVGHQQQQSKRTSTAAKAKTS
jgi:hypothetical protein